MRPPFVVIFALTSACSFSNVRSAVVNTGPSFTAQASMTTEPGKEVTWFYSDECVECNDNLPGLEGVFTWGERRQTGPSFSLGVGLNFVMPFAEAYVQLGNGSTPYGIGARAGWLDKWKQFQLFGRVDKTLKSGSKFLWNPGVFLHDGTSPNEQNPGRIVAFVNGFGLEMGRGPVAFTPSVSVIASHAWHESLGIMRGPENRVFGQAGVSVTLRRSSEGRD